MEFFIENQLKIVAYSFILGLIFGAAYDIIKIAHILCRIASYQDRKPVYTFHPVGLVLFALFDLLYFLFVIPTFSAFVYGSNHGDFRLFLLLPAVFGFWVYEKTVGRLVMILSETIAGWIRRVFAYMILMPLRYLMRITRRLAVWFYRLTLGRAWRFIRYRLAIHRTEAERRRLEKTLANLLTREPDEKRKTKDRKTDRRNKTMEGGVKA